MMADLRVENYSSNYYLKQYLNIDTSDEYIFYYCEAKRPYPFAIKFPFFISLTPIPQLYFHGLENIQGKTKKNISCNKKHQLNFDKTPN